MVKLSFLLLKNRKRFTAAIIGIITFSAILSLFSYVISTSNYNQKKELAMKNYGSFVCGICELSAQDNEKIREYNEIQSGHIVLYDEIQCTDDDSSLTIGSGDENFFQMANVEVLKGIMPAGGNEIAVEQFAAGSLGISGVGESVTLTMDGIQKTAKVTAIVRNYSNQINVYYRLKKRGE